VSVDGNCILPDAYEIEPGGAQRRRRLNEWEVNEWEVHEWEASKLEFGARVLGVHSAVECTDTTTCGAGTWLLGDVG
jgi:hypothetical protein